MNSDSSPSQFVTRIMISFKRTVQTSPLGAGVGETRIDQ